MEARGRRQITSPRRANKGFLAPLDFEALRVKIGDDTGALFNGEAGASFLVGRVKLRFAFSDHRFRHEKKTCEGVPGSSQFDHARHGLPVFGLSRNEGQG